MFVTICIPLLVILVGSAMTDTQAYYATEFNMTAKSFMIRASGAQVGSCLLSYSLTRSKQSSFSRSFHRRRRIKFFYGNDRRLKTSSTSTGSPWPCRPSSRWSSTARPQRSGSRLTAKPDLPSYRSWASTINLFNRLSMLECLLVTSTLVLYAGSLPMPLLKTFYRLVS